MTRLWVAIQVLDYDRVVDFYRSALGLPEIDGWADDHSLGTVFAIGDSARIEIESASSAGPPHSIALELPALADLQQAHRRLCGAAPLDVSPLDRHPRGHHGFTVADPAGNEIYLWSETHSSSETDSWSDK